MASEEYARAHDLPILARITGYAAAAIEPKYIFACPPRAVPSLLERTGMKMSDFDVIEVNEAFAAQVLANGKELEWDWDARQPQRRRGCARPSHRRERRAGADDAGL